MKRLWFLLFPLMTFSQDNYISFSAGLDTGNAIGAGVTDNTAQLNYVVQFAMVASNIEVNLGAEIFPVLDLKRYSLGVGYHFPLYAYIKRNEIKTTFIPALEPSLIDRYDTWGGGLSGDNKSSHMTLALNLALQWDLNDNLSIQYAANFLPRTDLKSKYPEKMWNEDIKVANTPVSISNFIKLVYRIERY